MEYRDRTQQYFQAQKLPIDIDEALRLDILGFYDDNLRRLRRKSSRCTYNQKRGEDYAKLIGSPKFQYMNQRKTAVRKKRKWKKTCMQDHVKNNETHTKTLKHRVDLFKSLAGEGPYLICVICNRCMYKKSVIQFKPLKYIAARAVFTSILSFDGLQYIFKT